MAAGCAPARAGVRGRTRRFLRVAVVVAVILTGTAAGVCAWQWAGAMNQPSAVTCAATLPVHPVTLPVPLWYRHRYTLQAHPGVPVPWLPRDGQPRSPQVWALNERTGHAFEWAADQHRDGSIDVLVQTRYALVANRRWQSDPWVLCLRADT